MPRTGSRSARTRGATTIDAVVLGAGPAGCLAAAALLESGRRVLLLHRSTGRSGDSARPQGAAAHVHRIPAQAWQQLDRLLPTLRGSVIAVAGRDGPLVCRSVHAEQRSEPVPWPSRALLDRLMRQCVMARGAQLRQVTAVEMAAAGAGAWQVAFRGAAARGPVQRWRTPFLVDASGAARASLGAVAAASGEPVPLLQLAGREHYHSFRLTGARLPRDAGAVSVILTDARRAIIQRLECGTGDGASHLLTCIDACATKPASGVCPSARGIFESLRITSCLSDILRDATVVAPPARFGPLPLQLLEAHRVGAGLPGWLALGDALLVTPPVKGLGISWAVTQAECVRRGLLAGCDAHGLRQALAELAEPAWMAAGFEQAFSHDSFPADLSFDSSGTIDTQESRHA